MYVYKQNLETSSVVQDTLQARHSVFDKRAKESRGYDSYPTPVIHYKLFSVYRLMPVVEKKIYTIFNKPLFGMYFFRRTRCFSCTL